MRLRVRFRKYGVMRFVGHLDLMRYFQKAIRRAELPIKYSEGFSPHQILSFAAPLGVGLTSDGEYMEMEVAGEASELDSDEAVAGERGVEAASWVVSLTPADVVARLQAQMAEGVEIVSARVLPDNAKNAMAALAAARYRVYYRGEPPFSEVSEAAARVAEFTAEGREIIVTKQTKKGERTLDLAPHIYEFTAGSDNGKIYYEMLVSAGSTENIRPELVTENFHGFCGLPFSMMDIAIHRVDMYEDIDGRLVSMSGE